MTDIISYWDGKMWIVFCVDSDGNQIWDAEVYPNRKALRLGFLPCH